MWSEHLFGGKDPSIAKSESTLSTTTLSKCAIMTIDPGGKTGITWGWFNLEYDSIKTVLARARKKNAFHGMELSGPVASQSMVLLSMYEQFVFKSNVEYELPMDDIHVVIEDFQLRKQNVDLAPVEITAGFMAPLMSGGIEETKKQITAKTKKTDHAVKLGTFNRPACPVKPVKQLPSEAMNFATNQRLRDWGAWFVGSEHTRDASRHLCVKLSRLLG